MNGYVFTFTQGNNALSYPEPFAFFSCSDVLNYILPRLLQRHWKIPCLQGENKTKFNQWIYTFNIWIEMKRWKNTSRVNIIVPRKWSLYYSKQLLAKIIQIQRNPIRDLICNSQVKLRMNSLWWREFPVEIDCRRRMGSSDKCRTFILRGRV